MPSARKSPSVIHTPLQAAWRIRSGRNGELAGSGPTEVAVGVPGPAVGRGVRVGGCQINGVGDGPGVAVPGGGVADGKGVDVGLGVGVAFATCTLISTFRVRSSFRTKRRRIRYRPSGTMVVSQIPSTPSCTCWLTASWMG